MSAETEALLAGLDDEQREVAQTLRGPVSVLAGAGTGKTRTITHRIAHGVMTGAYRPDRVLAVTFTAKAAAELRSRLRLLGAGGVSARTFHSAALSQLGYFWPQIVGGQAPQVLPGKSRTLAQAADAMRLRFDTDTLRDVASEIEWRKLSSLGIEAYAERLDERSLPNGITAEQLLDVMGSYETLKDERRQIDFEDVLIIMTGMLEVEPRVAMQVREQFRFFTVDEYQDVSPLQHNLLRAWVGDRTELCVVGDASQTIYSFAGADSSYLLRFGTEFPSAREFRLEQNYRSTPGVVRAANSLMAGRPGALSLQATRDDPKGGSAPLVQAFGSDQDEADGVARAIAGLLREGVPASEIAVLYRTNAQSARIESALDRAGISTHVHGVQRFFDRAVVKQAIMALRGQALAPEPGPLFQQVSDVLRSQGWTEQPPAGAAQRERWDSLGAILALVDDAPPGTTLRVFSDDLVERAKANHEPTLDAVTLSAIHAAKGLEWGRVFVVGVTEGVLPIRFAETEAQIEEERRLFYVATTRARDRLYLSTAGQGRRGPSRFLAELGNEPRPGA